MRAPRPDPSPAPAVGAAVARVLDRIVFCCAYQRTARALSAFAALVLPSTCVVCGTWDTSLCTRCLGAFRRATMRPFRAEEGAESLPDVGLPGRLPTIPGLIPGLVPLAREEAVRGRHPPGPSASAFGPLPVLAAGRYGRTVSVVLLAFKNHGHVDLAAPVAAALGGVLHAAVGTRASPAAPVPPASPVSAASPASPVSAAFPASPPRPVLLVPVPTRASSRRRRGYDPLMLLLSRLDRAGGLPAGTVLAPAIRQIPPVRRLLTALQRGGVPSLVRSASAAWPGLRGGQKGLGRRRRRAGVQDSMSVTGRPRHVLADRDCLIVDDVLTTGATIGEAHRVLTAAGARVLGAVVMAATSSPSARDPEPGSSAHRMPGGPPELPERRWVNKGGT